MGRVALLLLMLSVAQTCLGQACEDDPYNSLRDSNCSFNDTVEQWWGEGLSHWPGEGHSCPGGAAHIDSQTSAHGQWGRISRCVDTSPDQVVIAGMWVQPIVGTDYLCHLSVNEYGRENCESRLLLGESTTLTVTKPTGNFEEVQVALMTSEMTQSFTFDLSCMDLGGFELLVDDAYVIESEKILVDPFEHTDQCAPQPQ